jgi:phage terminase small subunit
MTPRQNLFVLEYLLDLNATQAAIRAGYSVRTAATQGERLLKIVQVAAAIAAGMEARSERTKINADWLLSRLADEAEADLADLYDERGDLRPIADWPLIWRQGLVAGIEAVEEKDELGRVTGTLRKIKLSDRVKRLEMIGKHVDVQAFRERVDHGLTPEAAVAFTGLSPKELADRYRDVLG